METPTLMPWEEIVAKLLAVRVERGLSLRQLAQQTGVSFSTLSRFEHGMTTRSPETWRKLSEWIAEGRAPNDPSHVSLVGPEGAVPHIHRIVAGDRSLSWVQKETLNVVMAAAYDVYREVQNAQA